MYNVAEFVITIYCLIEDEWYPAFLKQHGLPRRAGFAPALSASEGLTIELVGQYLGYSSQKQLYEHRHDRFGAWFPALRCRVVLPVYGHDSTCRDALLAGLHSPTQVLGDAAFLALDQQQQLKQNHIHLRTPIKRNRQPTHQRKPVVAPGWAKRLRRHSETVYAQLVQRFHGQTMKGRDAWHLQSLWITKILTHSICVWLNIRLKRKPLDLDGLVQF